MREIKSNCSRGIHLGFLIICMTVSDQAIAQTRLDSVPADHFITTPGGVDLRSGRYMFSEVDVDSGADGGLTLVRTMPEYVGAHANPFGNFSHNWDIMLNETRVNLYSGEDVGLDYRMNVHFGGRSLTFDSAQNASGYGFKSGGPTTLLTYAAGTKSSATAIYTLAAPDGTIMKFRSIGSYDCANQTWGSAQRRCAYISEMIQPDGTKLTFEYIYNSGLPGNRARLNKIESSRGYALLIEGNGSLVTKACVINVAYTAVPADQLCPANIPATTYSYSNFSMPMQPSPGPYLGSVTKPTGGTTNYSYAYGNMTGRFTMGIVKPGYATPWLTNTLDLMFDQESAAQEIVNSQAFSDGQSYTYSYNSAPATNNRPYPPIAGGSYVDALGRVTGVEYGFPILPGTESGLPCTQFPCSDESPDGYMNNVYQQTQGPVAITDPLGRTTTFDYCDPVVMNGLPAYQQERCAAIARQWAMDPDGIKTYFKYDGYNNVIEARKQPKPGSALAAIIYSATFDCYNKPKSCTKPTSVTNAKGQVTTYTYDANHGGVLTETMPAVGGVAPQKRHEYAQRYAWFKNSAGNYVQAAAPIWVKTRERLCKTTAASGASCAGGAADEVVTDYDYGPNSGPNNLLVRGVVVTATNSAGTLETQRTCYGYDAFGRKISETKPAANLTSCQ